jgi:1,4-dihydroxy-2-naphthoyl-CoA hydrolase
VSIPPSGLGATLGIVLDEATPERMVGHLDVTDAVRQPYGVLHGGALLALAEELASLGTYLGVTPDGMLASGQEINASLLAQVREGRVDMVATPVHRGRTAWVWTCEARRADGRLCCAARCTIAVRAPRA